MDRLPETARWKRCVPRALLPIYAQASNNNDETALVFSFRLYHDSSFDIDSSEVDYYFRKDGSLVKIHARLNAFYENMAAVRERSYDSKGRLLSASRHIRPGNKKEEKTGSGL